MSRAIGTCAHGNNIVVCEVCRPKPEPVKLEFTPEMNAALDRLVKQREPYDAVKEWLSIPENRIDPWQVRMVKYANHREAPLLEKIERMAEEMRTVLESHGKLRSYLRIDERELAALKANIADKAQRAAEEIGNLPCRPTAEHARGIIGRIFRDTAYLENGSQ